MFKYKTYKDKITLTEYIGEEEIIDIPEEIDGKIVRKIASFCFFDNSNIKEINFPKNIVIEDNAIVGCENIETISILDAFRIGSLVEDCEDAIIISNSANIYNSLKRKNIENIVYTEMFYYHEKDGSICIDGIKNIKKLKTITIPNIINNKPVKFLAKGLFKDLNLETIRLNKYIEILPEECFLNSYVKNLLNISNIRKIEYEAFFKASISNDLYFENVYKVDNYAFGYFNGKVSFSKNLKILGSSVFHDANIDYFSLEDFKGTLPTRLFGWSKVKKVVLPKNIKKLPEFFFNDCQYLEEVENLEKIIEFGDYSLQACNKLKFSLDFKKIKIIGQGAFSNLTLPEKITIGDIKINSNSFAGTKGIRSVKFSNKYSCDEIPKQCFRLSSVEKVSLNDNIRVIREEAFALSHLKEIDLTNIEEIGVRSFDRTDLKKVNLNSLKRFDIGAFTNCTKLKKADLSKSSLVSIQRNGFCNCTSLKEVLLPNTLERLDEMVFHFTALQELKLPDSLRFIGSKVFTNTSLKTLEIPKNVESIGYEAFCSTNASIIVLGSNVSIGARAFASCNSKLIDLSLVNIDTLAIGIFERANIDNLILPKEIKTIDFYAFKYSKIKNIVFDFTQIEHIKNAAFEYSFIKDFPIINNAKYYGISSYHYYNRNVKNTVYKNVCFENVEEFEDDAFEKTLIEKVEIKGTPKLGRFNFENCGTNKIIAPSKVITTLKSRKFFKQNSIDFEKIK